MSSSASPLADEPPMLTCEDRNGSAAAPEVYYYRPPFLGRIRIEDPLDWTPPPQPDVQAISGSGWEENKRKYAFDVTVIESMSDTHIMHHMEATPPLQIRQSQPR